MALWQAGSDYPFYGFRGWPLALTPLSHQQLRDLAAEPVALAEAEPVPILDFISEPDAATLPTMSLEIDHTVSVGTSSESGEAPPVFLRFFASVGPEVAERWLDRSLSAEIPVAPAVALPACALAPDLNDIPALAACEPVPAAEPVSAWIGLSACAIPVAVPGHALALPAMDLPTDNDIIPDLAGFQPVPAAEPASAWLRTAAAFDVLTFGGANVYQTPLAPLPILSAALESAAGLALTPGTRTAPAAPLTLSEIAGAVASAPQTAMMPLKHLSAAAAPEAQPVVIAGTPADSDAALTADLAPAASTIYVPALPAFTLTAELEPLPAPEEPLEIPALCERLIPAPAPEPVWSFLQIASAGALDASLPQARPVFAGEIGPTFVPRAEYPRAVPSPEPVMAGVWPRIAETPLESIDLVPDFRLPQIAAAPPALRTALAAPVGGPAAEPVETLLVASQAGALDLPVRPIQLPSIAALHAAAPAGALAPALVTARPEEVAAWISSSSVSESLSEMPLALQPFQIEASHSAEMTTPERPPLAPSVAEPAPSEGKLLELRPVATIHVALPDQQHEQPLPAMPKPGLVAIEYHMQRTRSVSYERPEWKSSRYEPLPPEFTLRPVLDNPEDLIKPKPDYAGVFPINAGRTPRTRSAMIQLVMRVAAAVLIITSMWVGGAALKNARRATVRQDDTAFATPDRVLTPSQQADKNKEAEAKGPLNWVKKSIANRASVQVAEDFQKGMQKWGAEPGGMAPNWHRNPAGYAQTGSLALLNPTRTFTDYKLEFFGQIEAKSVGWVVRAKDDKNYHAMKFNVLENGLRPIIAVVHYNVIDGKAGRAISNPLNVMVHNNKPFQVAVTVKGKRFVTEVDGEEVDSYTEDLLPVGGVGFFSDAGERARLYWARVTKNDDWIGHFCAFLSGGDTQATAELWPPAVPGGFPAPWTPAGDSTILSAAWIGLPTFRRTHSPRRHKRCNR